MVTSLLSIRRSPTSTSAAPMVLGINIDLVGRHVSIGAPSSQWWTQLSSSVAGGLAFATILTLFLTPSFLMISANLSQKLAATKVPSETSPRDDSLAQPT